MLIHNSGGNPAAAEARQDIGLSSLRKPTKEHQVIPMYPNLTSPENLKWKQARSRVLGAAWKLLEATAEDEPKQFELRSTWWKIDPDGVE